jgi:hypothetical protein
MIWSRAAVEVGGGFRGVGRPCPIGSHLSRGVAEGRDARS